MYLHSVCLDFFSPTSHCTSRCSQLQYIFFPFVSISFLPLLTVPFGVPSCNISSFRWSQFLFSHFSLYHSVFPVAIYLISVRLNFFSPTSHGTITSFVTTLLFFGPASARSYKIGVIGNNWLVGWLVGNAVFSETAVRVFLIFCMRLGDYKGRKFTEPDFWKKILIWRYSRKSRQISPKSDTDIFSQKRLKRFFWFLAWS